MSCDALLGERDSAAEAQEIKDSIYSDTPEGFAELVTEVHANTAARAGITVTINDDGSLTLHKPE